MRKIMLLALTLIILTGCNSSVKNAKAEAIRHQTDRADDWHIARLEESEALMPVRIMVKEVLWYTGMVSGILLLLGSGLAGGWWMVGTSVNRVKFHRVSLDVQTRQYPLLVYGNGRRVFNPNTGERLLLAENSEASLTRIEASTKVQLAGMLPDRMIIDDPHHH